jgi:hypothetical protein
MDANQGFSFFWPNVVSWQPNKKEKEKKKKKKKEVGILQIIFEKNWPTIAIFQGKKKWKFAIFRPHLL